MLTARDKRLLAHLAKHPSGLPVRMAVVELFGAYEGSGLVTLSACREGPLCLPDPEHFLGQDHAGRRGGNSTLNPGAERMDAASIATIVITLAGGGGYGQTDAVGPPLPSWQDPTICIEIDVKTGERRTWTVAPGATCLDQH